MMALPYKNYSDQFFFSHQHLLSTGEVLKQTRCRAGNSWPSKSGFCAPFDYPFSERQSLQEAVNGFDDPLKKPMASFFRKLAKENGALLIAGDSVMQRFYSAMACELERENVWKEPSKFTNTDEVQYVRDPSVSNSNSNSNSSSSSNSSSTSNNNSNSNNVDSTRRISSRTIQPFAVEFEDGSPVIYFNTNKNSRKMTDMQKNPYVSLTYLNEASMSCVAFMGTVER